jgi:hypothetical protein
MLTYLKSGALTDTPSHAQLGSPVAFGVTLAPVPPAVHERFAALIGASSVSGEEVVATLVDGVGRATRDLAEWEARLVLIHDRHAGHLTRAQELASLPVNGTEGDEIGGMVLALERDTPSAPTVPTRLRDLRAALCRAVGFDAAPVERALAEFDEAFDRAERAYARLLDLRRALSEAHETAISPTALAGANKLRASAKIHRALTSARVDRLEDSLKAILDRAADMQSEIAHLRQALN